MSDTETSNQLDCLDSLTVEDRTYTYYSLTGAEKTLSSLSSLPKVLRILLENVIRHKDQTGATVDDMRALCATYASRNNAPSLPFAPSRLLLNDEDAVSVLTDWAALREEAANMGENIQLVALTRPLDIVVDRTLPPFLLNRERMELLKWGAKNLNDIRIIPPGHGGGEAINLDFLSPVVGVMERGAENESNLVHPDIAIGSYESMGAMGAIGSLGWQTDALDIEQAMLSGHIFLTLPGVIGVHLKGTARRGISVTDIALGLLQLLRNYTLNDSFVEFHGSGLENLSVPDRAVIAQTLCTAGAKGVYFPVDGTTLTHLSQTGRPAHHIALIETYAKAQGLWHDSTDTSARNFTEKVEIELDSLRPGVTGLTDPHVHTPLVEAAVSFGKNHPAPARVTNPLGPVRHGDLVWAALTDGGIANTRDMIMAGLIAKKACGLGLSLKPWVKPFLSIDTPLVYEVLQSSGLLVGLEALGFRLKNKEGASTEPVLPEATTSFLVQGKTTVGAIASCASLLEKLPSDLVSVQTLAAPGLVIAYAIAGSIGADLANKPMGQRENGSPIYLKDVWPTAEEIDAVLASANMPEMYRRANDTLWQGDEAWEQVKAETKPLYPWIPASTYVRRPPTVPAHPPERARIRDITDARILAVFGDNVRTEHLVPTGEIIPSSPAGLYLQEQKVQPFHLGPYEQRTGNFDVMVRGAGHHEALVNHLAPDAPAGATLYGPTREELWFYEAAERYRRDKRPLIIVAGQNFGAGPEQEWAAKITRLLGVQAVIAESFDPAHRLNLIRAGVLPLKLKTGLTTTNLNLAAQDIAAIYGLSEIEQLPPDVMVTFEQNEGVNRYIVTAELYTEEEKNILRHGGLWAHYIRSLIPLAV